MVNTSERLLVLGASGFLGTAISTYFSSLGIPVMGIDIVPPQDKHIYSDFYQSERMEEILEIALAGHQPTYLVHVAGNANVGRSIEDPRYDFVNSVDLFSLVLDHVRRVSLETKVLFTSSAAVYGQPKVLPITEELAPSPISPYGYHKWMCEQLSREYSSLYEVSVASIRIFSAYGAGLRKQILWDLCEKCRSDGPVQLGGDGSETRDFIHAKDIARAISCIVRGGTFNGEVYNVASGVETSISDLAHHVLSAYGIPFDRLGFSGSSRIGDPKNWRADVRRLEALGFSPTIDFVAGVAEYVDWYKKLR
ncbi:NAD-dependent epimerase/dehydratase family protein [Rhizobium leguminosarum bv. viciae]|nr:NAD-dependent epimerase/dehydratase family protein [Rhizobium leguminosarum bv. viciae]